MPKYVREAFAAYLKCGRLEHVCFARALRGLPRREACRLQLQAQGLLPNLWSAACEGPRQLASQSFSRIAKLVITCTSRYFAFKILASALEADPDPIATQSLLPAHVGPMARRKPEGAIVMHDELPASHRDHRTVRIHHSSSAWERTWRYRS